MENLKYILISLIILVLLGLIGYWAIFTIKPGNILMEKQRVDELSARNQELEQEIKDLKSQLAILQPVEQVIKEDNQIDTIIETANNNPSKYQSLINELQKLIDDNVSMKLKSMGTRIGSVQKFLNIYNNTSKKVDNDYGAGTKTDVVNFQKKEGLTADGEAGPTTFVKMIDWLKKQ